MRTALADPEDLKLAGPKSLLAQLDDDRDDEDFAPGAESEVEEEFDEGDAERDDERPPFADGGLMPADPALVQQLDAEDDGADDGEFGAAEAAEGEAEEIAEEYDEGPVVDDERPPFADADVTAVDPVMAAAVLGVKPDAAGAAEEDNDDDDDFTPGAEEGELIAEEYDEGPVVDDERPPFADADVAEADPDLVQQLGAADDDDDAGGDDFAPGAESEVEEEFDEGDAERDDERPVPSPFGVVPPFADE